MSSGERLSATSPETLQSLIIKHQEAFRNLRTNGSSERELRSIRRSIAELALKQKSLFETTDERDNNADEIDAIVHRTIEHLPDATRNKALFLRRMNLLLVDAARTLEAKREARKRRRTALNSVVSTASGKTELMKRRCTRPLRSTYVSEGFPKPDFDSGWLRAGSEHAEGDFDVLDIDIAVKNSKIRSRRCKICEAGGDVEVCKLCETGYHVGICIPAPATMSSSTSSKFFICPDCSKKSAAS